MEELARKAVPARIVAMPNHTAECPQGASVAVFRATAFRPLARVGHEVPEPPKLRTEGVVDEGEIAGNQGSNRPGLSDLGIFHPAHEQKAPGIVIQAISLGVAGNRKRRVLQNARVVRHGAKVSEIQLG